MLANNVIATPRPRPPAKARRSFSSKLKTTSPPPSDFRFPSSRGTVLGSPVSLTAQIAGWDGPQQRRHPSDDTSWINAASREELYDLFTKADDLIKERESELNMTSAVCRSLYDHNVALKNKHEALLARIPGTPAQSTTPSPISPVSYNPLVQSPHYYSDSLRDASDFSTNNDNTTPSSTGTRHNRRVSVCPLDIALLSDQNAELLDKVAKLESESTQADQTSRRALKKLEREIQGLREELERTQAKGDELEEKAKAGFGISAEKLVEEMWKQREEREERIRALRRKPGDLGHDENEEHEVRDFAPGALWASPPPDRPPFPPTTHLQPHTLPTSPPPDINFATKPVSPPVVEHYDNGDSPPSSIASLPEQEYAVVSQLLLKIQELEETNAQIRTQQAETAAKLRAVHRDTRRISKLYECLGDQTGVEWEAEEGQMKNSVECDVIRFQSLRKSLENDFSEPAVDDDVFKNTVAKNHSTVRGHAAHNFNTVKRPRKTVVGLFDTPVSDTELRRLNTNDSTLPLSLLPPADPDTSRMSWLMGVTSPALSELSLETQTLAGTSTSNGPGRTLGSELGSEFGDDWGANAGNHLLKKTSLYGLCQLSMTQTPPPVPVEQLAGLSTPQTNSGPQASETTIHETQFGVDTPTPKPSKGGGQSTRRRIRRLNNTPVTDYKGTMDAEMDISRPSTPETRLSGALSVLMEAFNSTEPEKDTTVEDQSADQVAKMRPSSTAKKEGFAALLLEVWLWLQFILIILVFLWAMAKRGPKTVLDEAEHRRTRLRH